MFEEIKLYTKQAVALRTVLHAWDNRKAVNLLAGQRAGKTVMARHLVEQLHGQPPYNGTRFIIVGPTKEQVKANFACDLQGVEYWSGKQLLAELNRLIIAGDRHLAALNKAIFFFEEASWYPEAKTCVAALLNAGKHKILMLSSRGPHDCMFSSVQVYHMSYASWDWNDALYDDFLQRAKTTNNVHDFNRDFGAIDTSDPQQYAEMKRALALPRPTVSPSFLEPVSGEQQ